MLKASQIQKIYGMAAQLGLVENGHKNDLLHEMIFALTEKKSVKNLNELEYKIVVKKLAEELKVKNLTDPPSKIRNNINRNKNGITAGQQKKVWQLMYSLEKLDKTPSTATLGQRLCGIIKKELNIDASIKSPMEWLSYANGSKLIEKLKVYIANAEKQRRKDGGKQD